MILPGAAIADLSRAHPRLAVLWWAALAGFLARSMMIGDDRVWAYAIVVLVVLAVVAYTDRSVHFSPWALSLLLVTGVLHLSGGLLPDPGGRGVLYDAWLLPGTLRFDQAVHAFGSIAATVASWQVLGTWLDLDRCLPRTQAVLAALMAMGKGGLNEALEFLAAIRVAGTYVGGFENTGWDLVFDLAGVISAAVFLALSRAPRRPQQGRPVHSAQSGPSPGSSW